MSIDIEYFDDPGDQFVLLFGDGGVFKQPDGSLKLWWKPF